MVVVAALALALLLQACSPPPSAPRQYELQGQILAIRPQTTGDPHQTRRHQGLHARHDHAVQSPRRGAAGGQGPGDLVTATLMVADTEAWIASLVKTGTATLEEIATIPRGVLCRAAQTRRSRARHGADRSNRPPVVARRTGDGSAVAITFIYVRCPLPQFCPTARSTIRGSPATHCRRRRAARARPAAVGELRSGRRHAGAAAGARREAGRRPGGLALRHRPARHRRSIRRRRSAQRHPRGRRDDHAQHAHGRHRPRPTASSAIHDGSDWTAAQIADDLRRALAR